MCTQDPSTAKLQSKETQELTAEVKQEGSSAGLPQQPAWSKQAAHSLSQAPILAAGQQHAYGRQLPPPPPIPQHKAAASYQQPPGYTQYHHASAASVHQGGPTSAYQHAMPAQQHYLSGVQQYPANLPNGGAAHPPTGYVAGWPNGGSPGGLMQYGQQSAAHPGPASHGGPYPGPPPFPQQGSAAASWPYGQAAGLQAKQHNTSMGMQQQQPGNLQTQQQQQEVQPVSSRQQAGNVLGAGLALSPELLNSLKSLAPALQQLQQPDI